MQTPFKSWKHINTQKKMKDKLFNIREIHPESKETIDEIYGYIKTLETENMDLTRKTLGLQTENKHLNEKLEKRYYCLRYHS